MDLMNTLRIFLTVLMLISVPLSATDRGPVVSFSYSPSGIGYLSAPGPEGNGGDTTKPESGSGLTSASRLYLSGGYYYDYLQADLSYTRTKISKQVSDFNSEDGLKSAVDSSILLRCGYRFSNPGDTSYTWLYAGLKRYSYESFGGTDLTAYGWLAGYSGFYSFGLSSNYEFVLALDLYLGTYRFDDFSSDNGYTGVSKRYSVTSGAGIGAGVQYEPYNVTLLLKLSADINRIAYDAKYLGSSRKFSTGSLSGCIGFEVRYTIPGESYNEKIK
jgi:hypothetical protein